MSGTSPDGVIPDEWKSGYTLNDDNPVLAAAGGYQNFRAMLGLPPGDQEQIPIDELFTPPPPTAAPAQPPAATSDDDELLGDGLDEHDLQAGGTRDVTKSPQHHKLQLDNYVGEEEEEDIEADDVDDPSSNNGAAPPARAAPPPPPPPPKTKAWADEGGARASAGPSDDAAPRLCLHGRVEVRGLTGRPELNGQWGTIVRALDSGSGRYGVQATRLTAACPPPARASPIATANVRWTAVGSRSR
jgi:hypothetical protein